MDPEITQTKLLLLAYNTKARTLLESLLVLLTMVSNKINTLQTPNVPLVLQLKQLFRAIIQVEISSPENCSWEVLEHLFKLNSMQHLGANIMKPTTITCLILELSLIVMSIPPISALSREIRKYGYIRNSKKWHNCVTSWRGFNNDAMHVYTS